MALPPDWSWSTSHYADNMTESSGSSSSYGIRHYDADSQPSSYTDKVTPSQHQSAAYDTMQRFAGFGISCVSLVTEHLISHPFIVLRRQCQINSKARCYHLTPFTILPVWMQVQRHQGLSSMWKGMSSVFMLKGITMVSESAVSELLDLPREVTIHSSIKHLAQNVLLKAISQAIITPFYSASLVETVESEIASDDHGVFGCIKEGVNRLVTSVASQGSATTRALIPVYQLVPVTVLYGALHYCIKSVIHYIVSTSTPSTSATVTHHTTSSTSHTTHDATQQSPPHVEADSVYQSLHCNLLACLWSDALLYPLETVMNRLHVQGTRTILDNLDCALEVTAISSRYEGAVDCYRTVMREEGFAGLYKGFGAVVLQYVIIYGILRVNKLVLDKLVDTVWSRRQRRRDEVLHPAHPAHRRVRELQQQGHGVEGGGQYQ